MPRRLQRLLVAHGALVFIVGLVSGFPFALATLAQPVPGDVRGWRMAHLEGVLNGLTCFAVAAVGPVLRLSPRAHAVLAWTIVVTAWGNQIASVMGPLLGGRGLELGHGLVNDVMYVLFVVAVVTIFVAMGLVVRGAAGSDVDPPAAR
jgi:hypothetical protein